MKKLRWIAVAVVLALAAGWWSLSAVNGVEEDWVAIERDDLVLGVDVAGTLSAVNTDLIGPPQLRSMWQFKISQMAPEGEEVTAGTPVVAFDTSELQQRLQRETAERDAARKRIEKAEKELAVRRQQDLLRLAEAEAALRKSELKAAAPEQLEAAIELALVKLDLELARKEVAYLGARLESAARSAEATLAALRDQLERAEQDVEQTRQDIQQMSVTAGRDGTVIYVTDWNDEKKKIGDSCWKGDHVLELPDLGRMKATGRVHEADAGRISEGQRVTLRLDAHAEVAFTGSVASIWRTVQRESWRSPKKVVRLEVELDETDTRRMRPGMRYRGKIETERVDDALLVDAAAIFLEPEGPVVFRRTLWGHEVVPVELGRRNERRVEVLSGLAEGEEVLLTDPRRREGDDMTLKRALGMSGGLILILAASAGLPLLWGIGTGGDDDVPTYVVERGEFTRQIHAEGNLKAADATPLGPPPEVRRRLKIAWLAADGSHVKAGDVVIRFDPTDLEEELREGRHDRATTDSRITAKKVREEGSRRNLDRDADVASLELDYAQSFQSKDELIFSRQQIIEAEIDETLALHRRDHAQEAGQIHHELTRAELDLLGIERRKAELKISQAEEALESLEVRAPHDGIFVTKEVWGRKPEVGQTVWAGNTVAEIPKPEKMEAEVYVLEADAGGLEVGPSATVVLDAHPDVVYQAEVSQVAALAQRRNHRSPIQYFTVTLELERTDPSLMKPGQRVRSALLLEVRQDVLTVPRQTVFEDEGKKIVYVRRGGGFEPTEVSLGASTLGRVVIEDGLAAGDRIALRDPTRPADEQLEPDSGGEPAPPASSGGSRTVVIIG